MPPDEPITPDAAFDAAPDGLVVVDPSGRVALANRRATVLLGQGGLVGEPLGDDAILAAEPDRPVEVLLHRPDGSELALEATVNRADLPAGWVIVALRD